MPEAEKRWFRMDNAGLIFIPASNSNWACAFRVACVLKNPVNPAILKEAAASLAARFPSMLVHVKAGLFWHYIESVSGEKLPVKEEKLYPLQKFSLRSKRFVIRILYQKNRIAFECFHAISDATGAFVFLNSLVREYLRLLGEKITGYKGCKNPNDRPTDGETEDAFLRYAKKDAKGKYVDKKAVQFPYEKEDPGVFNLLHFTFDADELKQKAKSMGATVGEFFTACLFLAYDREFQSPSRRMERLRNKKLPVKISIPIDLRRKYPSETLRNFSLYMNMEMPIDRPHTFEEILATVKQQYAKIDEEYLLSSISKNVKLAGMPIVKFMPLPIKNLALKIGYNQRGEKLTTMSFSNLGVMSVPPEFSEHIERYEFSLGPLKLTPVNAACVTFNGRAVLTISSRAKNVNFERSLIAVFRELELSPMLDTNWEDCVL